MRGLESRGGSTGGRGVGAGLLPAGRGMEGKFKAMYSMGACRPAVREEWVRRGRVAAATRQEWGVG